MHPFCCDAPVLIGPELLGAEASFLLYTLNSELLAEEIIDVALCSLDAGLDDGVAAGDHIYPKLRTNEQPVGGYHWVQRDATYVFSDPCDRADWLGFITLDQRIHARRLTLGFQMVFVRPEYRGDRIGRTMCQSFGLIVGSAFEDQGVACEICLEAESVHGESSNLIGNFTNGLMQALPGVHVKRAVTRS